MSLIFEWWMKQIFIGLLLLRIIFLTKLYGITNLQSFLLIWLSCLSYPSKIIFLCTKRFIRVFSNMLIPCWPKCSLLWHLLFSHTTLSKIYQIQTHMLFIHFVYLLLEISGFFPCMSIQIPSYLYWLIVWHWTSVAVQDLINGFIKSWCCQFYFVIYLLCTALYSWKNSTFHKTLTVKTQGGREIWIQTNFMSIQFTNELYCLVIILLLHLPCNHGNMENEYWKIRTICICFLAYTSTPSYSPKDFEPCPKCLAPTIRTWLM